MKIKYGLVIAFAVLFTINAEANKSKTYYNPFFSTLPKGQQDEIRQAIDNEPRGDCAITKINETKAYKARYLFKDKTYIIPIAEYINVIPYRTYVKGLAIPAEDAHANTDFATVWIEK